ncbi:MAB_1171c family putative transporter [Allosalinactinospora lopnorensis]|uniref:MAB_1171c family putative transporter n=1 Tax=Allosalinactinospora lopnorensis TaxID=1352348 RepID=UPI000623CE62|nr:MAB_1171c family putative transporter [Allosalinactinospora lopnorensis]
MESRDAIYLIAAATLTAVLAYKLRHLYRNRANPKLWAICSLILFGGLEFWFSAPANASRVNEVTGVSNIAMPLIFCSATINAASVVVLALYWRYPPEAAWRRIRWVLALYGLDIAAMVVLFGMSSVPKERMFADFITEYATQPTVGAFLMIRFVTALITAGSIALCCFAWARSPDFDHLPWLRRALRLWAAASSCFAVYGAVSAGIVVATWLRMDALNQVFEAIVPLTALVGASFAGAALVAPLLGARWRALRLWVDQWRVFFLLRPLHRAMSRVAPGQVFVAEGKRLDPHHRTRRMVIEFGDWQLLLAPLLDPAIGAAAERLGQEADLASEDLATTVEAAQLKAALCTWERSGATDRGRTDPPTPRHDDARDGNLDSELLWWVRVARAFGSSPVVAKASAQQAGSPAARPV